MICPTLRPCLTWETPLHLFRMWVSLLLSHVLTCLLDAICVFNSFWLFPFGYIVRGNQTFFTISLLKLFRSTIDLIMLLGHSLMSVLFFFLFYYKSIIIISVFIFLCVWQALLKALSGSVACIDVNHHRRILSGVKVSIALQLLLPLDLISIILCLQIFGMSLWDHKPHVMDSLMDLIISLVHKLNNHSLSCWLLFNLRWGARECFFLFSS